MGHSEVNTRERLSRVATNLQLTTTGIISELVNEIYEAY